MSITLTNLLTNKAINLITIPSNRKYGQAIFERGGVEFINSDEYSVEAWSGGLDGGALDGGGQRRRVKIWVDACELAWHCAGNPKDHDIFCKHCVAVALDILGAN